MGPVGYCSIRPDGSKGRAQVAFDTFEECHPGAIEVAPRLEYMDEHGLTMQIVYPNVLGFAGSGIMRIKDEAHRRFCATAYNDACSEFQAESRGRLFPQAMLPFWDVAESVRELERCQDDLGLTGFVITDATNEWGLPPLHDAHWDLLWDAAQSRGMPGRSREFSRETSRFQTVDYGFSATILQFKSAILALSASVQDCPPF